MNNVSGVHAQIDLFIYVRPAPTTLTKGTPEQGRKVKRHVPKTVGVPTGRLGRGPGDVAVGVEQIDRWIAILSDKHDRAVLALPVTQAQGHSENVRSVGTHACNVEGTIGC